MKTSLFAVLLLAAPSALYASPSTHQEMVNAHGAQVMPFDTKVAMHMFTPDATGGAVEVMVHNMDPVQIALVRRHLRAEAAKFAVGDYSDPAYIHGKSMPGLAALEADAKHIRVRYSDTSLGARITLTSLNRASIGAIHRWLAAQTRDHRGMGHMKM